MRWPTRVAIAAGLGMVLLLLLGAGLQQWHHHTLTNTPHSADTTVSSRADLDTARQARDARAAQNQTQVFLVLALSFLSFVALTLLAAMVRGGSGGTRVFQSGHLRHGALLAVGATWGRTGA